MTAHHSPRTLFGLTFSQCSVHDIVYLVTHQRRNPAEGPGLIATANLDHVVTLSRDPEFFAAYSSAALITADGFPVYYVARLRGLRPPGRVTGTDITAALLGSPALAPLHRLFFVADSAETTAGLQHWAAARGLPPENIAYAVPPHRFEHDPPFCAALAGHIARHNTTILLMGVGAPRSEIFLHRHRAALPPCWALCVGQSLRVQAGLTRRAPAALQKLNLEWLWRLAQEPRRLARRYAAGSVIFLYLAIREILAPNPG